MRQISEITGYLKHPVKGASTAFAILFAISGFLHIWQNSKYKSWYYTYLFPCACVIFTASFICREYTAYYPTSDVTFTAIQGLFYSAVPIITAPLYSFLARLLATHLSLSPIWPRCIYTIPMCLTYVVISITAQGTSTFFGPDANDSSVSSGLALIRASLIMQLSLNVAFIALLGISYRRYSPQDVSEQSQERWIKPATIALILCISMAGILVRNIFSTVQIFLPSDAPAWTTEAYFWVFEAAPMLACTLFLHICHPAKYLLVEGNCCMVRCATGRVDDSGVGSVSAKRSSEISSS